MARTGINYIDVSKAAQALLDEGKNPTVERVRVYLGTGSNSTISPLLSRWKQENSQSNDTEGLSSGILRAVKAINESLQQSADLKIEEVKEEGETQVLEAKDKLDKAIIQIEQLTCDNKELKSQLELNQSNNTELRNQLETERIKVAHLSTENEEIKTQFKLAKSTIQEQKQELQQVRESAEHYQTQSAEDRQRERDQYQTSKQQLEEVIQTTRQQLDIEMKRSKQLENEKLHLTKQLNQFNNELDQTKETLQSQSLNMIEAIQKLELKETLLSELQEDHSELNVKHASLMAEFNDLNAAKLQSEYRAHELETRLSEANNKASILDGEHKIVCQEKAMLQGQFKQLQESMRQ